MTTITDRLAEALREAMDWNWHDDEALPQTVVRNCNDALDDYEAQKANPCPTAVNWRDAIEYEFQAKLDSGEWVRIYRRAIELAKQP